MTHLVDGGNWIPAPPWTMKFRREHESHRAGTTNALLDALAGSLQTEARELSLRPDLPPIAREVVVQAHDLRIETDRVVRAARKLPASRSEFIVHSLGRWRQHFHTTRRARKVAWQEVEAAARSTAAGTENRLQVMSPALHDYLRTSGAFAFSKATFRGLIVAELVTAASRIAILASVALVAWGLDQKLDGNRLISFGLAIVFFVVLDRMLVDRLLEPALEEFRFHMLLAACAETIKACEGIEDNPWVVAAALDGVILPVSAPDEEGGGN
jgi:hypothetical protein